MIALLACNNRRSEHDCLVHSEHLSILGLCCDGTANLVREPLALFENSRSIGGKFELAVLVARFHCKAKGCKSISNALVRFWAIAADLLSRYEITHALDASLRRILIGALDVARTYREDAVHG